MCSVWWADNHTVSPTRGPPCCPPQDQRQQPRVRVPWYLANTRPAQPAHHPRSGVHHPGALCVLLAGHNEPDSATATSRDERWVGAVCDSVRDIPAPDAHTSLLHGGLAGYSHSVTSPLPTHFRKRGAMSPGGPPVACRALLLWIGISEGMPYHPGGGREAGWALHKATHFGRPHIPACQYAAYKYL